MPDEVQRRFDTLPNFEEAAGDTQHYSLLSSEGRVVNHLVLAIIDEFHSYVSIGRHYIFSILTLMLS